MDNSPEYMEQCEKAVEIQQLEVKFRYDSHGDQYIYKKDDVWLPRQDQLQEIAGEDLSNSKTTLFYRLYDWKNKEYPRTYQESWEQLWLAFVMHERFGKYWDFETKEWVNE